MFGRVSLAIAFIFVLMRGELLGEERKAFLIVANAPAFSEKQVRSYAQSHTVVALDGAANEMRSCGIVPQVILGDFDSIKEKEYWGVQAAFDAIEDSSKPYVGNFQVLIVPAKNQDKTDLEKAILYCDSKHAASILILNATGGRMDHTLGNIGLLRKMYRKKRPLFIQTEHECIQYVKDAEVHIKGCVGDQCAIMAYPEATMTTTGLQYNGDSYKLQLGIQESSCNRLAESVATIAIKGEALVMSSEKQ